MNQWLLLSWIVANCPNVSVLVDDCGTFIDKESYEAAILYYNNIDCSQTIVMIKPASDDELVPSDRKMPVFKTVMRQAQPWVPYGAHALQIDSKSRSNTA